MFLVRLIYCSKPSDTFNIKEAEEIVEKAAVFNASQSITGLMCFSHSNILQCLEGGRQQVNHLYQKILHDKRHKDIELLDYREIEVRDFNHWSMKLITSGSLDRDLVLKYSQSVDFDPYEMHGESCHQLLRSVC